MNLKLGKLPDREAAKISFTASAELKAALNDYAEIYRQTYGQKEGLAQLIPFMLGAFIEADPEFKRARKQLQHARASSPPQMNKESRDEALQPLTEPSFSIPLAEPDVQVSKHPALHARATDRPRVALRSS